jgi:hypothetical protein
VASKLCRAQNEEATMAKRWISAALAVLGLVGRAAAQAPAPIPLQSQGPAVFQAQFCGDPAVAAPPQFCAAEGGAPAAGGTSPCTLPNDGTPNGFTDGDCCRDGYGFAVIFGGMGLQRQSMGNKVLGFLDPGVNINGTQVFANTGTLPPAGTPAVLNTHDISPEMQAGVRASLIWREPEWAVELTGFYSGVSHITHTLEAPAQIDLGFNFFPTPIGFTPGNGLWLQDDLAQLRFQTQMYNGEANYRFSTAKNFEWILGVRYVDYAESFGIMTEQTILRTGVFDPNTTAFINDIVHDHILAAQVGFETEFDLTERIGVGCSGKAGVGPDFVDYNHTLQRGDDFYGPSVHRSETQVSQVYEIDAYFDFAITEQFKIRAGYQAIWLVDLPLSANQLSFDLGNTAAPFNKNNSVFYSGPMLEVQFVF